MVSRRKGGEFSKVCRVLERGLEKGWNHAGVRFRGRGAATLAELRSITNNSGAKRRTGSCGGGATTRREADASIFSGEGGLGGVMMNVGKVATEMGAPGCAGSEKEDAVLSCLPKGRGVCGLRAIVGGGVGSCAGERKRN